MSGPTGVADPCPKCGTLGSAVKDSRPYYANAAWRHRRRLCASCGERWSTLEVPLVLLSGLVAFKREVDAVRLSVDRLQGYLDTLVEAVDEDVPDEG